MRLTARLEHLRRTVDRCKRPCPKCGDRYLYAVCKADCPTCRATVPPRPCSHCQRKLVVVELGIGACMEAGYE